MCSHPTWREARLVSESAHAHGATGSEASGDQRVPCPVHTEEAFLMAEPVAPPNRRPASPLRMRRVDRMPDSLPAPVAGGGR
jgi:hypothetical protein